MSTIIETERLILRTWVPNDAEAFYWINQDPKVIEFLQGPLSLPDVENFMTQENNQQAKLGFTLFATELKKDNTLLGFIGLNYVDWESNFTPAVEIGWRLGSQFWGKGFAIEGAKAVLQYGFETVGLNEIISFTVPANTRSIRVMEKLGLNRDFTADFNHPKLPIDHKLSKHILYRLTKDQYFVKIKMDKSQQKQ